MSRDELAIALEELAEAIRELGEAIDGRSRSNDRPARPTLLSPPSVTDVLRTADELAIPALITILEAQIRTLRYLQRGSRFVRRGKAVDDRLRGDNPRVPDRYADPNAVLDQLGSTLDRIGRRLEGSADEETRQLLDRSRSLYEDIDDRLADYERQLDDDERNQTGGADGYRIDISEPGSDETDATTSQDNTDTPRGTERGDEDRVDVDIDAELDTLRERYGSDEEGTSETDGDESESGERADADTESGDPEASENSADADDGADDRDGSANTRPDSSGDSGPTSESEPPAEDDDSPTDT